jgi:hypothetical protein
MPLRAWTLPAFLLTFAAARPSFALEPQAPSSGTPAVTSASPPSAPPAPPAPPALRPTSTALAVTLEMLSPVGGAGAFYRGRPVEGALVVAGSLVAGGLLLYAALNGDRDATIVGAVAFATMRGVGIAAAAPTPVSSVPAAPRAARPVGLSYALSF